MDFKFPQELIGMVDNLLLDESVHKSKGGDQLRTLFVRNITSNISCKELMTMFGAYGDIKDIYTACKYRGFVMISFFDERAALSAMKYLQGKSIYRRKMDIHFSIPKENQVDMGTLLVSNIHERIGMSDIVNLFQNFGDVKSIKDNPLNDNVRIIGFYDQRHAAAAMKALNNAEVWGIILKVQYAKFGSQKRRNGVGMQQQQQVLTREPATRENANGLNSHGTKTHSRKHMRNKFTSGSGEAKLTSANETLLTQGFSKSPNSNSGTHRNHFALVLESIFAGKDTRTTVMIRNIPNKYTQKMLLAEVNEHLLGKYDFFYLPIDFKNKCNVGYAFINLIAPSHIFTLYQQFNGKRWSNFNSGKIAEITYARIQGKNALVAHFKNSALMTVDAACQPWWCEESADVSDDTKSSSNAVPLKKTVTEKTTNASEEAARTLADLYASTTKPLAESIPQMRDTFQSNLCVEAV